MESAGALFRENPDCPEENGIENLIVRCNIAMLIWSAAIDIGSSLMIQEERRTPVGRSSDISDYITRDADRNYPEMGLRLCWRDFLHLHNIQHRADHEAARLTISCRSCHRAFASINRLIIPANRLTSASYEWLATVGEA